MSTFLCLRNWLCVGTKNCERDIFDSLVEQMQETKSIGKQFKERNRTEWICRM